MREIKSTPLHTKKKKKRFNFQRKLLNTIETDLISTIVFFKIKILKEKIKPVSNKFNYLQKAIKIRS